MLFVPIAGYVVITLIFSNNTNTYAQPTEHHEHYNITVPTQVYIVANTPTEKKPAPVVNLPPQGRKIDF
jgi:hypothetical protein